MQSSLAVRTKDGEQENPSLVEDLVREFETRYKELYGRDSPWSKDVEAEVEM